MINQNYVLQFTQFYNNSDNMGSLIYKRIVDNHHIDLKGKHLSNDDLRLFIQGQNCDIIYHLFLSCNDFTSQGMNYLSTVKWSNLAQLTLNGNKIGNKGCKYLSRVSIINLRLLYLNICLIESAGVLHLAKAQWTKLRRLNLNQNKIDGEGVRYLVGSNWSFIMIIMMSANKLSYKGIIDIYLLQTKHTQVHMSINNVVDKKKLVRYFKDKPNVQLII